jgi:hypothetical protein
MTPEIAQEICFRKAIELEKRLSFPIGAKLLVIQTAMLEVAVEIIRADLPKKCSDCGMGTNEASGICPVCQVEKIEIETAKAIEAMRPLPSPAEPPQTITSNPP